MMLKIHRLSSHASLLLCFFCATSLSLLSVLTYGIHYHHYHPSISQDTQMLKSRTETQHIILSGELAGLQNGSLRRADLLETYSTGIRTNHSTNLGFNFSLPWHDGATLGHYVDSEWFKSLLNFTQNLPNPEEPVFVICSDHIFREALLNWLISALVIQKEPPQNILVITNRNGVCSLVDGHKLPAKCFKMQADSLLTEEGMGLVRGHPFSQLLVIRMSIMRILNHLGHDVINMDADAIMLRNPIPVLEQNGDSDVVGTFGGSLPTRLYRKWGLVACMGAVMIRSTAATEKLWEDMGLIQEVVDDQVLFNTALEQANISWKTVTNVPPHSSNTSLNTGWVGHTSNGLKVTLLPLGVACRGDGCQKGVRKEVYIWHHGKNKHKIDNMSVQAEEDEVWFLKKEWTKVEGLGLNWLRKISIGVHVDDI